uniref:Uncharacterized protein n=1 Tax=Diacronema lutheri TaxID=2081491 RepID=A0A7R9UTD4_DIALT
MPCVCVLVASAGLHVRGPHALGVGMRPARMQRAHVLAAAGDESPADAELSAAEAREKALAEGELPMPTPMARSAFALSDGPLGGPARGGDARTSTPGPTTSRADEVNEQLMTRVSNSLRQMRWSDEPLALTAVKTATWAAIFGAVFFEVYLTLFYQKPS